MFEVEQNNQNLPAWLFDLLIKIKSMTFIADDEEIEVEYCVMGSHVMCDTCEPYANLDELDDEDDFTKELGRLIQAKWRGTKRELCEKALLLENTFYKIQAGRRQPGRDTIICLSLALGLSTGEAQDLLGYLGCGLSERIKRDYIILRCLEMGKKPLEVNMVFENCGLHLLGPND